MPVRTTILVADRSALVVEALEALFVELNDGNPVLTATSLVEALELAQREQPDLILLEAWMGTAAAEKSVRQVLERSPRSALFMMTTGRDPELDHRVRQAGARGCCDKEELAVIGRSLLDSVKAPG